MKNIIIIGFLISFILSGIVFASVAEELPLGTDEWEPYVSKQMEGYGICTEIISAVVKEMGMTPKYSFFPWKRLAMTIKSGAFFAAFPCAITPERQKEFDFSDMILENNTVFFYHKQQMKQPPVWRKPEDLKPYRIGGVSGYSYVAAFDRAGLKVDYTYSEEANLKMLYAQRVDLIITDETVGRYLIQKLYPDEQEFFGVLEKPFVTGNSHLMISRTYPGSQQLRKKFDQALQLIKEKGIYEKILSKYSYEFY